MIKIKSSISSEEDSKEDSKESDLISNIRNNNLYRTLKPSEMYLDVSNYAIDELKIKEEIKRILKTWIKKINLENWYFISTESVKNDPKWYLVLTDKYWDLLLVFSGDSDWEMNMPSIEPNFWVSWRRYFKLNWNINSNFDLWWRLPTVEEILILFKNKEKLNNYKWKYWTNEFSHIQHNKYDEIAMWKYCNTENGEISFCRFDSLKKYRLIVKL